ncbi:hypothetical protein [Rhodoferax sp.]|uniref:NACHT and WD40 repeat domain-containing protein n=1 Tax=Rhodoferax sp. TaxID=50421 RepID=UPI00284FCF1B|nr:hypothetical protein [Rhodoferax sp.]MDR3370891.1 hypothetical protein [Rhodoferax sp.]
MSTVPTVKASPEAARAAWARLTPKQRKSVVGSTFASIIGMLDDSGTAPLGRVLDALFDDLDHVAAHTALKTQFINRPFAAPGAKADTQPPLLKLCASRVALKDTAQREAAFARAQVWFEVPALLDPATLATEPNADVAQRFTDTLATDLSQSEVIANAHAQSAALRRAELAQFANGPSKAACNWGTHSMRHGAEGSGFQEGTFARDAVLGSGDGRSLPGSDSQAKSAEPPKPKDVVALPTLLCWAQNTANDSPRLYALLGDSGTGKTSHGQQFVRILNGEITHPDWPAQLAAEDLPKALFIDLAELAGVDNLAQLSLEDMLVLVLKRRDGVQVQTVADVAPLVADACAGRLIFVFDGLDELLKNDSLVLQKAFEQFLRVVARRPNTPPGARPPKAIVSCRSHYFRDIEAQHSFFTARGRGAVTTHYYRCLTLLPWGHELIEGYLTRRVGAEQAAQLMALIRSTYNLEELASRPVLLSMMSENIQSLLQKQSAGQPILAATLYSETVASWIERDQGKHRLSAAQKPLLMGALAAALWNDGAEAWPADRLDQWLVRTVHDLFPGHYDAPALQGIQDDLRTATFIVRPDARQFNFAHRSYGEYFLARFMIDGLTQTLDGFWSPAQLRAYLPQRALNPESMVFLSQLWTADQAHQSAQTLTRRAHLLCRLLQGEGSASNADMVNEAAPALHAVLWQMLRAIPWPIKADATGRAGSGSADVLPINLRGLSFVEERWENLNLTKAPPLDLRGANLRGLYALRCQFGPVRCDAQTNFSQAVFRRCDTRELAWNGAQRAGLLVRGVGPVAAEQATPLVGPWIHPFSSSYLNSVAFHPSGALLASAGNDGMVYLWDTVSQRALAVLRSQDDVVTSVVFNPNGAQLASAGEDGTVCLWDVAAQSELAVLRQHGEAVRSLAYNADGTLLASGGFEGEVCLWDVVSQQEIAALKGHDKGVDSVAFNPGSTLLASAGGDGLVRLWDVLSHEECAALNGKEVLSLVFDLSGRLLVGALADGSVSQWDVVSHRELAKLKGHRDAIKCCTFNTSGTQLASVSKDGQVLLWDVFKQKELVAFQGHRKWVSSIAFHPGGTQLASAAYDSTVEVWDIASQRECAILKERGEGLLCIAFSPDGMQLAIAGGGGTVHFWDVLSPKELAVLKGHADVVKGIAFDPCGKLLASAGNDGVVRLWDMSRKTEIAQLNGHSGWVNTVSFNPDGTLLASADSEGVVRLWDVANQRELAVFEGHYLHVSCVAFNSSGTLLASAGDDGIVCLWDVEHQTELAVFEAQGETVLTVAFNPGGALLASAGDDGMVRLWDVAARSEHVALQGDKYVSEVAFSPDGSLLASADEDGTVRLWNVAHQSLLAVFKGHDGAVNSIAFQPNGTQLASAGADGTVRLWNLEQLFRQLTASQPSDKAESGEPAIYHYHAAPYRLIVPHPLPPFAPSWADFDAEGRLLDWSESAIDHWLFVQRDGRSEPIEAVL